MNKGVSVFYTDSAKKDLKKIDKTSAKNIIFKIEKYSQNNPLLYAKALLGIFSGLYRYRVGDYRAIFSIDTNGKLIILTVLRVKHRKDIYRI